MKIEPKIVGNVCLTAHPAGAAAEVKKQIKYVQSKGALQGPKNVLVLGCSGGYGLATRIVCAYACNSTTLGASFEREPAANKTASVGWYNNAAFSKFAAQDGKKEATLNIDAFSEAGKTAVVAAAKKLFGDEKIDFVVYSLASPMRAAPDGQVYKSVLKPIGKAYKGKTVDIFTGSIKEVEVEPANDEEIKATVKVMGGEDWVLWIDALLKANLLAKHAVTVAYSYIGPELTYAIYREGTIGRAKDHLEKSAAQIMESLSELEGGAYVSVNKAVVTRASSVIPVVPLYISLLFKIMKENGKHEGCIEQEYRMMQRMYNEGQPVKTDSQRRIRLDDWEMEEAVQARIKKIWADINEENLKTLGDLESVRKEFMNLHGFEVEGINYDEDIDPQKV